MDIAEFRIVRPPVADLEGALYLQQKVSKGDSALTVDDIPKRIGSKDDNPLQQLASDAAKSPLQSMYEILNGTNDYLRRSNDWVKGKDLLAELKTLDLEALSPREWELRLTYTHLCLTYQVGKAMAGAAGADELQRAATLTRLALIADLLALRDHKLDQLDQSAVFAKLNGRIVTVPDSVGQVVSKKARVELIRDATVSDFHVIRREWAGYVLGEVANIRNLMAGEMFGQTQTALREREVISTTESDRQESTQQEDSSKLATELTQEVTNQLSLSVNGYVDASVQYKTPVATINVAGGASVGLSLQRGEKVASKVAREAVTRAVRTVDTRTRETRSQRELTRDQDVTRYRLRNSGSSNLSAVYRWVDRVDRYQIFRFPDRLQLEFQIPEPAEFYRMREKGAANAVAGIKKPPETFDVTLDEIDPKKLIDLAKTYQATNLPTKPEDEISLSRTLTVNIDDDALPDGSKTAYNAPSKAAELEVPIPSNYVAAEATYSGHAYPIWSKWEMGSTTTSAQIEGFHSGFASVSVGEETHVCWVGGYRKNAAGNVDFLASYGDDKDKGSVETVQWTDQASNVSVKSVPFGRATLLIGGDDAGGDLQPDPIAPIKFDPGVAITLKVGITTVGLTGCVVTVLVKCKLSDEALLAWQLSVYDALYAAWGEWTREYNAALLRQSLVGSSASDAGSSQRNEEIIREELKRQVITWLLSDEQFAGRPALRADQNAAGFHSLDIATARRTAPTIQFLEQAFEWGNMMYMFYPYYWAAGADWPDRAQITANDPDFELFLKAGSSRVVVPVRPAFNDAVKNWLMYQVPFITGQLPSLGDPLFVAIDREIRDLTSPLDGGIAEDTWESIVSTTMVYLQSDSQFPIKNDAATLPVEKNAVYAPKPFS